MKKLNFMYMVFAIGFAALFLPFFTTVTIEESVDIASEKEYIHYSSLASQMVAEPVYLIIPLLYMAQVCCYYFEKYKAVIFLTILPIIIFLLFILYNYRMIGYGVYVLLMQQIAVCFLTPAGKNAVR